MPSYPRSDSTEYVQSSPWTLALENDASGNPLYVGRSVPADCKRFAAAVPPVDPKSQPIWQIQKLSYDGNGLISDSQWADGDDKLDNVWAARAVLSYY